MKHFCWRKSNCLKLTCNRKHFILILIVCLGKSVCRPSGNKSNVKSRSFFRIFCSSLFLRVCFHFSTTINFIQFCFRTSFLLYLTCCFYSETLQYYYLFVWHCTAVTFNTIKVCWASSKKVIFSLFCVASFNQNTVLSTSKNLKAW